MRILQLTEYRTERAVALAADERDALRALIPTLTLQPSPGADGQYDLNPGGSVGVVRVGDLHVRLTPRLPIERVLFLVSYALDPKAWLEHSVEVDRDDDLLEAIIPAFAYHVRVALRRGLLHGYRRTDESETTIRGRIRFADQIRARPGQLLPVEITYDDFTPDILENRLLRAAIERILQLPLRRRTTRQTMLGLREQFATITHERFAPRSVPEPVWTRLNGRYRPAVSLARLIIQGASLDLYADRLTATGVVLDMAKVFEDFVVQALREALELDPRSFLQGGAGRKVSLDLEGDVSLKPDLAWWAGDQCVFVGDCKYKRTQIDAVPNADLYQLLAYTTALNLPAGLLVYAAGEYAPGHHTVRHAGKRLEVATLDLAGRPTEVLAQISALAQRIKLLARQALAA